MTKETIKVFRNEKYSKGTEQNYITNKTNVYNFEDIWSLDILDRNVFVDVKK